MKQRLMMRIARSIAEVARGLAASWKQEICCPKIHYAGPR